MTMRRRDFIAGSSAALFALPFLRASAHATPDKARRLIIFYHPDGVPGPSDHHQDQADDREGRRDPDQRRHLYSLHTCDEPPDHGVTPRSARRRFTSLLNGCAGPWQPSLAQLVLPARMSSCVLT